MLTEEFVKVAEPSGSKLLSGTADILAGIPITVGTMAAQKSTTKKMNELASQYYALTGTELTEDLGKYQKQRSGGLLRAGGLIAGTILGTALGGKLGASLGGKLSGKFPKVPGGKVTTKLVGATTTKELGEIAGASLGSNVASFADTAMDMKSVKQAKKNLEKDTKIDPVKKEMLSQALELQRESNKKYNIADTIDLFTSPMLQHGANKFKLKLKK